MSGTKTGGLKAKQKNVERHGADFYKRIGALGGKQGKTGGFASELIGADGLTGRESARVAGSQGGKLSKRPKAVKLEELSTNQKGYLGRLISRVSS